MVFENARYLPWCLKTLDIYRGSGQRSIFTVVHTFGAQEGANNLCNVVYHGFGQALDIYYGF